MSVQSNICNKETRRIKLLLGGELLFPVPRFNALVLFCSGIHSFFQRFPAALPGQPIYSPIRSRRAWTPFLPSAHRRLFRRRCRCTPSLVLAGCSGAGTRIQIGAAGIINALLRTLFPGVPFVLDDAIGHGYRCDEGQVHAHGELSSGCLRLVPRRLRWNQTTVS